MSIRSSVILLTVILAFAVANVPAQETQLTVIDEGIVQVNETVITLSRINREIKNAVDSLVKQGKPRAQAETEIQAQKGQIIASMISEELLLQKGKEIGLDRDVEARINQQFVQQMRELNMKSLDQLFAAMRQQGIEPDDIKANLRRQITREWVFQSQVDDQIRWGISDGEIKDYFAKNKAEFTKPATVMMSEIFLKFAGRNENAIREKAKQLVAKIRAGEDFVKLALENSERPNVAETKGSVGKFELRQLAEQFRDAIKDLKAGEVADPIELDEGMEILKVDSRTEQGTESNFDENKVRFAIMKERVPKARRAYMKALREEAYIRISESYRPIVTPFLDKGETPKDTSASK